MTHYYAGIGSRKTPENVLRDMSLLGRSLASSDHNIVLRSGAAGGADMAFEAGCHQSKGGKQIFLPWSGFNGRSTLEEGVMVLADEFVAQAEDIASKAHPAWHRCSQGARRMHTRNVAQVLGPDLKTPSSFVICWTPNGDSSGGTGQAIRIAQAHSIPVFDMGSMELADVISSIRSIL